MNEIRLPIDNKKDLEPWLPHRKDMLLIDGVNRLFDDGIESTATLDSGSPFFKDGRTPVYVSFELIAQSISVYSHMRGYSGGDDDQGVGFILKVSDFKCLKPYFKKDEKAVIRIRQEQELIGGLFYFSGEVFSDGELVASGNLLVMDAPNPEMLVK